MLTDTDRIVGHEPGAEHRDGSADSRLPREAALLAHLVEHHHARARRSLPYIVPLLAKVAGRHGRRNGRLDALCDAGNELVERLERFLDEEERALFPALQAGAGAREAVRREVDEMIRHHREVERLLARVRSLADGFVAPEWGDGTYRALMEELEALEDEVLEHVHLESFALIPCLLSGAPGAS
jgi:regulator of cell morphogenesis and NO signaling